MSGAGTQTLQWSPTNGDWTLVVMQADAGQGVAVRAQAGATVPSLGWFAGGLLAVGIVLLAVGSVLVAVAVHRAQTPPAGAQAPPVTPSPVLTGGPER